MMLELGLGRITRGSIYKAYSAIHPRVGSAGFGIFTCFLTLCYYPLFITWSLIYFFNSFKTNLPWLATDADYKYCPTLITEPGCFANVTICEWDTSSQTCSANNIHTASMYFSSTLSSKMKFTAGIQEFNALLLLGQTVTFLMTFIGIIVGVRVMAYMSYVTVSLPTIATIGLVGAGLSIPGSSDALSVYFGTYDSRFFKSALWLEAAAHSLFSLGATQGSLCAYSAQAPRGQNFVVDTYIIAGVDFIFSILAAVAVLSSIGLVDPDVVANLDGFALVFQSYPVALGEAFGYPAAQVLCVVFYLTLVMLGVTTMVAMTEGMALFVKDSTFFQKLLNSGKAKMYHVYLVLLGILWLQGFLYCTDMGQFFLQGLDHFCSPFAWVVIAFVDCIAAGWLAGFAALRDRIGTTSTYVHYLSYFGGVLLAAIFGFFLDSPANIVVSIMIGVSLCGGGLLYSISECNTHDACGVEFTLPAHIWNVTMYNVCLMRGVLNEGCCNDGTIWRVPRVLMAVVKYVTPCVTCVLFFGYVTNPFAMYQFPRRDANDPSPSFTPQLFFYAQLGPFLIMAFVILASLLPEYMGPIMPARPVEFFFIPPPCPIGSPGATRAAGAAGAVHKTYGDGEATHTGTTDAEHSTDDTQADNTYVEPYVTNRWEVMSCEQGLNSV
eukprot:Lankesteria_metandrocarpae@DN3297_c0_g1_i1.p1